MQAVTETAQKHELAPDHHWWSHQRNDSIMSVCSQFELNRFLGFALNNRYPITKAIIFDQIGHGEFDQIAATQLAIYSCVEQRKVTKITRKCKLGNYGPHMFGKKGPFLTYYPPLVPYFVFLGDCGKLDSFHDMPANPTSKPRGGRGNSGQWLRWIA